MVAEEEKKKRITSKSNFTRSVTKLNKLLDVDAPVDIVTPQYEKMNQCYDILEKDHNAFLSATDIDIQNHADGLQYILDIDATQETVMVRYCEFINKATTSQRNDEKEAKDLEDDRAKEQRKALEEEARAAEELKLSHERKEKFNSEKVRISSQIDSFNRMTINVKDTLNDISLVDKRSEWGKLKRSIQH